MSPPLDRRGQVLSTTRRARGFYSEKLAALDAGDQEERGEKHRGHRVRLDVAHIREASVEFHYRGDRPDPPLRRPRAGLFLARAPDARGHVRMPLLAAADGGDPRVANPLRGAATAVLPAIEPGAHKAAPHGSVGHPLCAPPPMLAKRPTARAQQAVEITVADLEAVLVTQGVTPEALSLDSAQGLPATAFDDAELEVRGLPSWAQAAAMGADQGQDRESVVEPSSTFITAVGGEHGFRPALRALRVRARAAAPPPGPPSTVEIVPCAVQAMARDGVVWEMGAHEPRRALEVARGDDLLRTALATHGDAALVAVRDGSNAAVEWIPRMLCFVQGEDSQLFARRLGRAIQRQRLALGRLRLALCVDCCAGAEADLEGADDGPPAHWQENILSRLGDARALGVRKDTRRRSSAGSAPPLVGRYLDEAAGVFRLVQRALVAGNLACGARPQPALHAVSALRAVVRDVLGNGMDAVAVARAATGAGQRNRGPDADTALVVGGVEAEQSPFAVQATVQWRADVRNAPSEDLGSLVDRWLQLKASLLITSRACVDGISALRKCCAEAGQAPDLVALPVDRAMTLDDFAAAQTLRRSKWSKFMREEWPRRVARAIEASAHTPDAKGWLDFSAQRYHAFTESKLARFVRLAQAMMADALRVTLEETLNAAALRFESSAAGGAKEITTMHVVHGVQPPAAGPIFFVDVRAEGSTLSSFPTTEACSQAALAAMESAPKLLEVLPLCTSHSPPLAAPPGREGDEGTRGKAAARARGHTSHRMLPVLAAVPRRSSPHLAQSCFLPFPFSIWGAIPCPWTRPSRAPPSTCLCNVAEYH